MKDTESQFNLIKNPEWNLAWQIVNSTDMNLFLTGKAGTGKTTFIRYLREHSMKRLVVLAPTGIAAINARGVTIHSFFQLPFSPFVPGSHTSINNTRYKFSKEKLKIIRAVDLIVIDEISMVRADLLDAIDDALRRFRRCQKPFGGVQMLLIGDLQQLAPVVRDDDWSMLSKYYSSPFFFDSSVLKSASYTIVELKTIFRQADKSFVSILNEIRDNRLTASSLSTLNSRFIPDFKPRRDEGYIRLTTHNHQAQAINEKELSELDGKTFTYEAKISGEYPELSYPTDRKLSLKKGAQVMFIKNDTSADRQYYNGMIGEICQIDKQGFTVRSNDDGRTIEVGREEWQNCKYKIDEKTKEITEEVEGTFSQYPVKTAWAITIHKSQGLTFSRAIIDVHSSFAHGQTYVALSRCRSLEGIVLTSPISMRDVISDNKVNVFLSGALSKLPTPADITQMRSHYLSNILTELFGFTDLKVAIDSMTRLLDEHLYKAYALLLEDYKGLQESFGRDVSAVSVKFQSQYNRMLDFDGEEINKNLKERIKKGAAYFLETLSGVGLILKRTDLKSNNKQIQKQIENTKNSLLEAYFLKTVMLQFAKDEQFTIDDYLQYKALVMLGKDAAPVKERKKKEGKAKLEVDESIRYPEFFEQMKAWRLAKSKEENCPAYVVLAQKALIGVVNHLPTTTDILIQIPHIGKATADKYGAEIIAMVKEFRRANGIG